MSPSMALSEFRGWSILLTSAKKPRHGRVNADERQRGLAPHLKIWGPDAEGVDMGCAGTTRSADSLLGGAEEPVARILSKAQPWRFESSNCDIQRKETQFPPAEPKNTKNLSSDAASVKHFTARRFIFDERRPTAPALNRRDLPPTCRRDHRCRDQIPPDRVGRCVRSKAARDHQTR